MNKKILLYIAAAFTVILIALLALAGNLPAGSSPQLNNPPQTSTPTSTPTDPSTVPTEPSFGTEPTVGTEATEPSQTTPPTEATQPPATSEPTAPTQPATTPTQPGVEYIGSLYTRQELEAMENVSKGYGPGKATNGNRAPYAENNQKAYGKYGGTFIAPDNGCINLTFDCG